MFTWESLFLVMVRMYIAAMLILGRLRPLTNGRCKITELYGGGVVNITPANFAGLGTPKGLSNYSAIKVP